MEKRPLNWCTSIAVLVFHNDQALATLWHVFGVDLQCSGLDALASRLHYSLLTIHNVGALQMLYFYWVNFPSENAYFCCRSN